VRVENHPDINRLDAIAPLKKAMTQTTTVFHLKVQQVGQACLFELSWGQGQQLSVTLSYPETLNTLYDEWNSIYLTFYKTALADKAALRGRVAATGSISPPPADWHAKLVQAQGKLLCEFHQWLRQGELYQIHSRIVQAAVDLEKKTVQEGKKGHSPAIEVFLACNSIELERLPWEAWEIGTGFAAPGKIRFVRMPVNIQEPPMPPQGRRRRARILAVLGDDTGLNFQSEREALRSLSPEITFVGWQPEKDIEALKTEIVNAISDARGWDILFFAGHSNEACLAGGQLGIAPGVSLFLNEIIQPLKIAKENGLQFALFNSCKGLSIANTLIDIGLSQVAIMREPIHNRVAEEFFLHFVQNLAQYKDVHESILAACQYLKLEKQLTYPSASLTPSLFRHPASGLFRLKPAGILDPIWPWLPTKQEAIALTALVCVSWQLSVQGFLLEQRVLTQAVYRQLTNQVPALNQPPVLLVEIDEASIKKAKISDPKPLNRSYLATLIDRLTAMKAKAIGIDVLMDRHQEENDRKLAQSLRSSVQQNQTWFVFATQRNNQDGGWNEPLPELANPNWSLQGDILVHDRDRVTNLTLAPRNDSNPRSLPFPYLLASAYSLNVQQLGEPPQPQLHSSSDWFSQVKNYITQKTERDYRELFSPAARLQPSTNFFYRWGQRWLHPIIDFSIPPEQVYERLPAWRLLAEPDAVKLDRSRSQVALIAAGGYSEAGISKDGDDNFPLPAAVRYWRDREHPADPRQVFPGGEIHAYMIHHFLNQRLVVPIPDLWLIAIAALFGKGVALALERVREEKGNKSLLVFLLPSQGGKWFVLLVGTTVMYGLVSLQLYVTAAVLLPISLPIATLWTYSLLALLERKFHA